MKKLEIDQVVVETATHNSRNRENIAPGAAERPTESRLPSVIVGRIAAFQESGVPLVDFPGNASGKLVPAQALVQITAADSGRNVALTFEDGDSGLPIIVGLFQTPSTTPRSREVRIEDESLVLSAKKEVVIRCGKSSITLTNAGKVLIQGEYLLSRSSGVNKIRGGSIQLN
jgi:Domain of unknown function (DUF6484)